MPVVPRVGRVLLDSALPQLDHFFDYSIPDELAATAIPGVRVRVPLRSAGRLSDGYLIEITSGDDGDFGGALSPIDSVVSPIPVLSPEVWQLARSVADRSSGTANDIIRLAVPGRQVRVEKAWLAAGQTAGDSAGPVHDRQPISDRSVPTMSIAGYGEGVLERMVDTDQRIALQAIPRVRQLGSGNWVGEWAYTVAQTAAHCWSLGRSAIVVVPDYRDQAQLTEALSTLVPAESVAALDARQSNPDRYRAFLRCLDGPRIVIGPRSAIYAPASDLGLIVLWDDGDPLHNEPLAPYIHARDAALVRQQQQECALIIAGHTRTVEVQRLVEIGWLIDVEPKPAVLPKVIPTASQFEGDSGARAARIPSTAWQQARRGLDSGPVLVQVARPGYSPVMACENCGEVARCTVCDGPLAMSSARAIPACRWCGTLATGWACVHCQHTRLRQVSVGSSRTADELGRAFPGTRVILADGEHPVLDVSAEPALVVATRGAEPFAEGGYRAILLLDGERMLSRETLRVADDCLRWWSNTIALAAPGAPSVLVGVDGFLARTLVTWQHPAFARRELADRRALKLPPAVRLVAITGEPSAVDQAVAEVGSNHVLDVLGPVTIDEGMVRSIIRFEYAGGATIAASLRAAVVRNATQRRRSPTRKNRYSRPPTLKIRFDDPEIL